MNTCESCGKLVLEKEERYLPVRNGEEEIMLCPECYHLEMNLTIDEDTYLNARGER